MKLAEEVQPLEGLDPGMDPGGYCGMDAPCFQSTMT